MSESDGRSPPPTVIRTLRTLAHEVEQWLAGEPVAAYHESFVERARRWIRKNQTLATSASATVVVAAISLTVLGVVVTRSNQSLAAANQKLDAANISLATNNQRLAAANRDLETANSKERAATSRADENAELAEERSKLALSTLHSVIFDLQRGLINVPGAQEVRRSLLKKALEGLEKIGDQFHLGSLADRDTAVAQFALAEVFLQVGNEEGVEGLTRAVTLFEAAHAIFLKLAAADPPNARRQRDLSVSYEKLGDVKLQQGDTSGAVAAYEREPGNPPKAGGGRSARCSGATRTVGFV